MKFILILLTLITLRVTAQEPDSSSALFQMRDAERNFARASVMHGRNASFVEYFADESVVFTDRWITNGKQFWMERKVSPLVLKWEPEFMDISDSRDFGVSTGPWEAQEYRPYTAPLSTGYYLSVWKKQPDGSWKVILDAGSSTPAIKGYAHKFSFPAGADKPVPNPKNVNTGMVCKELMDRELGILRLWESNPVSETYKSFLAPQVRIQRNGHLPTTNSDTIKVWIAELKKSMKWSAAGCGAASSGDIGFTYGSLDTTGSLKGITGHYVRIWRKQPDGIWKIILEMMNEE